MSYDFQAMVIDSAIMILTGVVIIVLSRKVFGGKK